MESMMSDAFALGDVDDDMMMMMMMGGGGGGGMGMQAGSNMIDDDLNMMEGNDGGNTQHSHLSGKAGGGSNNKDGAAGVGGASGSTQLLQLGGAGGAPASAGAAAAAGLTRRRQRHQGALGASGSFHFPHDPPRVDAKALFPNSDDMAKPHVCSVVADVRLGPGKIIDLIKLATHVRNVEVHPTRKTAVFRLREPRCAANVRMGSVITLTGCGNVVSAKRAAVIVCKIIRRVMDWSYEDLNAAIFVVTSTSVRFDLKHPLKIELLAQRYPKECNYEPESFCGCSARLTGVLPWNYGNTNNNNSNNNNSAAAATTTKRWAVTAQVYASGKVLLMGACTAAEAIAAYNGLMPKLHEIYGQAPMLLSKDDSNTNNSSSGANNKNNNNNSTSAVDEERDIQQHLAEEAFNKQQESARAVGGGGDEDDDDDLAF